MVAHGGRAAPETDQARTVPEHEIPVASPRVLLADRLESEAAVEALRELEIGDVQLDEHVRPRGSGYGQTSFPFLYSSFTKESSKTIPTSTRLGSAP
jgi:hypothetical protein